MSVLEARDRIGGRIWTVHDPQLPVPVELGAEFLHADADECRTIARLAGLSILDVRGRRWISRRGRLHPFEGFEDRIERVMKRLKDDRQFDRSFGDALRAMQNLSRDDRRLALRFVEGFHAADPERISEQSLAGSADDPNAMRIARLSSGYESLVGALASSVASVRLSHVVRRVSWTNKQAVVEAKSTSGTPLPSIETRAVIITLPLGVLTAAAGSEGSVEFDPPVPGILNAAHKLEIGGVIRVALRVDEPFWTSSRFAQRHGGERFHDMSFMQSLAPMPFPVWWTSYPSEAPLLVGWSGGPNVWTLAAQANESIADQSIRSLAAMLGMSTTAVARHVRASFTHNWLDDPYARGAYSYVAVGGSSAAGVLARPIAKTLYFAGEHASGGRNGTVDSAIASGRRAADQVIRDSARR